MTITSLHNYSNLKSNEIEILKSMEQQILMNQSYTIREIARLNFVSTSTVFNLVKKLNFTGYSELIFHIKSLNSTDSKPVFVRSFQDIINDYNAISIQECIDLLKSSEQQRISLLGLGYSEIVCDYISRKLSLHDFYSYNGAYLDASASSKNSSATNLLIVVSKSGETEDVLRILDIARKSNIKIISFTSHKNSTIAKNSALTFEINCNQHSHNAFEADTFFALTILVFEYILQMYMEQKT